MAGWDDTIFSNLPPRFKRGAARVGSDLAFGATHPFTALGNAIFGGLAAAPEAAGKAVSYGAGKLGVPNPELLGHDVQSYLEMPSLSPTGAAHVAPTLAAAHLSPDLAIFAGPLAKTADLEALKTAQTMNTAGHEAEAIWNKTGWFQGADRKWRYEIPDTNATVNPNLGVGTAAQQFNHPDLYEAYPDLAKIDMGTDIRGDKPRGAYAPGGWPDDMSDRDVRSAVEEATGQPVGPSDIPKDVWQPPEEIHAAAGNMSDLRNTSLHELQHAVQEREGFAPGGSLDYDAAGGDAQAASRKYWSLPGEVEARNVEARSGLTPDQLRENPPWLTSDVSQGLMTPGQPGIGRGPQLSEPKPPTPGATGIATGGKLFDYSGLSKVPDVPQFDLPRYNPPRGVPARIGDLTSNPDVRQGMLDTIQRGQQMGGADWYNADPLRQAFIDELGKSGDPRFKQYMDLVAATSPRSDVGTNVRNASYYYNRLVNGEPMPDVGTPNPQPYGHMAQRLHQQNAQTVAGGGWDPLQNPKPASFAQDLMGNQQPVAVDTHAFRLPGMLSQDPRFLETAYQSSKDAPKQNIQQMVLSGQMSMEDALKQPAYWQAQPKANEYEAMEQYYQGLAQDRGISPAQAQAAAWVGGGQQTGLASDASKPFIGFVEDRANKTADVRGLSPAEALSQFIRGKAPLLGVGGAGAAAIPWWQQWQQGQDQQQGGGYGQPSA